MPSRLPHPLCLILFYGLLNVLICLEKREISCFSFPPTLCVLFTLSIVDDHHRLLFSSVFWSYRPMPKVIFQSGIVLGICRDSFLANVCEMPLALGVPFFYQIFPRAFDAQAPRTSHCLAINMKELSPPCYSSSYLIRFFSKYLKCKTARMISFPPFFFPKARMEILDFKAFFPTLWLPDFVYLDTPPRASFVLLILSTNVSPFGTCFGVSPTTVFARPSHSSD